MKQPSARDLGAVAVGLAYRWADWVDRRDLLIEFVEDTTVRRTERISFTLPDPDMLAAPIEPESLIYAPLKILAKQTLLNSDIRDENGSRLTPLNTQRNGEVAGDGLVAMVEADAEKQGLRLTRDTVRELRRLAASPSVATDRARVFGTPEQPSSLGEALKVGQPLESPQAQLIRDLSEGFLQLVQLRYEPGRHREITVSYDQQQEWGLEVEGRFIRTMTALGGYPRLIDFPDIPIGSAQSTHVEILAPDEMQLLLGQMDGGQYDSRDPATRARARQALARRRAWRAAFTDDGRAAAMQASLDATEPELDSCVTPISARTPSRARSRSRVHLHVRLLAGSEVEPYVPAPDDDPETIARERARVQEARSELQVLGRNDLATFRVAVVPRRNGAIPAATVTTILTAFTLWVFTARLAELDGQTSAAVLLLAPVAIGAYLSRPGEHSYTTRSLAWIRRSAVTSGLLALVLSGMIAVGYLTTTSQPIRTAVRATPITRDCVASVRTSVPAHGAAHVPLEVSCPTAKLSAVRVPGPPETKVRGQASWVAVGLAALSTAIAVLLSLSFVVGRISDQEFSVLGDEPDETAFESPESRKTTAPSTVRS